MWKKLGENSMGEVIILKRTGSKCLYALLGAPFSQNAAETKE